jgi:glyceraldehyde-3-phosphate dehydrogenase/erythrose-4-phosphate dehydrogenase
VCHCSVHTRVQIEAIEVVRLDHTLLEADAAGTSKGILKSETGPLAGGDYINDPRFCIAEAAPTCLVNSTHATVQAWNGSNWGQVNRLADVGLKAGNPLCDWVTICLAKLAQP